MTAYLQQLQEDQSALQAMLERRRSLHEQSAIHGGGLIEEKLLQPSVKLLNLSSMQMLEDMLAVNGSLIEYFSRVPQPQPEHERE